jgi:fructosamine-3-kinase
MNDKEFIPHLFSNKINDFHQILGNGDVNRVFVVEQNRDKFVVRLNEANELPRFQKEAWCQEQALKNSILSPKTIEVGVKDNIAYMILEFIPGINGKTITDNKEFVWQTLGKYARIFNSIKVTGFGEDMTSQGVFSDSWQRYLNYNIDSLSANDKLLSMGIITQQQSRTILEKFLKLKNYNFNFGLVHGDLSLSNTIVDENKVTLIDWGCAEASIVPHVEFVDLFYNQSFNHDLSLDDFLLGYGMSQSEFDLIKPEIDMLNLLHAVDKLRWAIDKSPEKIDEFAQRVKTAIL